MNEALAALLTLRGELLRGVKQDDEGIKVIFNEVLEPLIRKPGTMPIQIEVEYAEQLILSGNTDLALAQLAYVCNQLRVKA